MISSDDMAQFISKFMEDVQCLKWEKIDATFINEARNIEDAIPEYVVAMLRASFVWRKFIINWDTLAHVMHQELLQRGLAADKIMRGLI